MQPAPDALPAGPTLASPGLPCGSYACAGTRFGFRSLPPADPRFPESGCCLLEQSPYVFHAQCETARQTSASRKSGCSAGTDTRSFPGPSRSWARCRTPEPGPRNSAHPRSERHSVRLAVGCSPEHHTRSPFWFRLRRVREIVGSLAGIRLDHVRSCVRALG